MEKHEFIRMLWTIVDDASTLDLWKRVYLDAPEDRLYHAGDRTWWRRVDMKDGASRDGQLFSADPPPEIQEMAEEITRLRAEVKTLRAAGKRTKRRK